MQQTAPEIQKFTLPFSFPFTPVPAFGSRPKRRCSEVPVDNQDDEDSDSDFSMEALDEDEAMDEEEESDSDNGSEGDAGEV